MHGEDLELRGEINPTPELEILIDNQVEVPQKQVDAAILAAHLVANKLLSPAQKREPLELVFTGTIVDGDVTCSHNAEAFPDGKKVVFAMENESMKSWQKICGPVATMLFITAHEVTHSAQIRKGDPAPSSKELIKSSGVGAYESDPYEKEAWKEALDLFKALRPHAEGTMTIGKTTYKIPKETTYNIDLSTIPDFIKS